MGLIINTKIKQLLKGYPTVSDKYNVAGGTNTDENPMEFGEVVKYGEQTGYYKKFDATPAAGEVAGICMAKNVKLVNFYPADGKQAQIIPGEAIDLFVDGYIAVELAEDMTTVTDGVKTTDVEIVAGKKYYTRTGEGTEASPYVFTKVASPVVGDIATYYEATAAKANAINEGTLAYLTFEDGAVKFTSTSNTVQYGKFTGITEYNYGAFLAEIVVK